MPSKRITKQCEVCGTSYSPPVFRSDTARFCSLPCTYSARKGVPLRVPEERRAVSRGYVYLFRPTHPDANVRGYVAEHRLVAEAKIGRLLTSDEVPHHRNQQRGDNRPCNIEVMTRAEHARLHGIGNTYGHVDRWSKYSDACLDCGTTERPPAGHGLCMRCYDKRRRAA